MQGQAKRIDPDRHYGIGRTLRPEILEKALLSKISCARPATSPRFACEERLQETLAANLNLIANVSSAIPIMLMGREVGIWGEIDSGMQDESIRSPRHRRPDLMMVDAAGTLTIAEVKLGRNPTLDSALEQAADYARILFDNPASCTHNLMQAFVALSNRDPRSLGPEKTIRTTLPGQASLTLPGAIRHQLDSRRIRIVVVADWISPGLLEAANSLRRNSELLSVDLVEVSRQLDGSSTSRLVTLRDDVTARPEKEEAIWEGVGRTEWTSNDVKSRLYKDRFYKHGGHRSRLVPWPDALSLEMAPGRAPRGDLHQVDRSRTEGCSTILPDIELLEDTQNPYSDGRERRERTDDVYVGFHKIAHATWAALREQGVIDMVIDDRKALQTKLVQRSGISIGRLKPEAQWVALQVPFDAMRDCATFGLCRHEQRGAREHRFLLT